ncbi:MAG: hypothetical protein AB8B79_00920 [Granulosicoccus sp.]
MVLIESDTWRLWSDPAAGVQWAFAEVCRNGEWHAVIPDCRNTDSDALGAGQDASAPLAAASFHMLPYSNRIRDGRFTFEGQDIQLDEAAKHAIHGALRKLPWKIVEQTSDTLICETQSSDHTKLNWPWSIAARIEQRVEGNSLVSTIKLTNQSDSSMPAGFGWHPYFVRQVNGSDATLTLPVEGVFPDAAGDCLPDGAAIDLPASLDFRKPRLLDADQRIDCCLSGLSGQCVINWTDGGIKLVMSASENCRYLVLFNPDMPHFAVEPVTNANDGFNLSSKGIESGVQVLTPGATLESTMILQAIVD